MLLQDTEYSAYQLLSATSRSRFLISLTIITHYFIIFDLIVNKLQGTHINLHTVHTFVKAEVLEIL